MQPIALCFYNWFLPYVRKKLASKKIKAKTIQVKKIHFYPILVKNKRVLYFPCRHLKLILLFINKMMGIYSWEEKMRNFYATGCITFTATICSSKHICQRTSGEFISLKATPTQHS